MSQQMVACVVLIRAVPGDVPALARRIAGIEGVAEVYSVSGDYDLIAIVRVKEYDRIAEIVTEEIAQIQGIERTNTLTAFRVYSKQDLGAAWDMFD
jgi:DNA-binding Lrp family transcriptional regulator